ncbi:hypothetical protein [Paraburkholderia megapolitana]|uniref:hypothetical protein n=1 Tax=Paraburkholderia megapolitana TaxID=420953 RepID=UPI0038B81419
MRKHTAALTVIALLSGCNSYHPVSTNPPSRCGSDFGMQACGPVSTATMYGISNPSRVLLASASTPQNEAVSDGYKEISARIDGWRKECVAAMSTPDLDPIRSKIEIFHDPSSLATYAHASLDAFPTNAEVPLIIKWNELRDACIKQEHEINLTSSSLTPIAQSIFLQRAAFASVAEAKLRQLTVALSQQKLTYGEFAQRRYQINGASDDAALQVSATSNTRDQGNQILAQQHIKQQFSAEIGTLDGYLHSVDARPPRTVRLVDTAAFGSRVSERTCGANCSSAALPEGYLFKQLRHGFTVSVGGLGGTTTRLVDFDTGTFSVIDFELKPIDGKVQSTIARRSDIRLAMGDLAQLRAVANMIWISVGSNPTAQVALDGFWAIRLVNGNIVRYEHGLGNVGGAGRSLNVLLYEIEERQLAHVMFEDRRMYQLWSCYPYPLGGHAGLPTSYIRTSGYSWSDPDDVPPVFPIPASDPLLFRFDVSKIRLTCAS